MLVRELQRLLARLYKVDIDADVIDYLVTDESFVAGLSQHLDLSPDENLLLMEEGDTVDIALYLNEGLLSRATRSKPCDELNCHNFDDFCKVLEGVSHFMYVAWNALNNKRVTRLELEMQAEVDKYVSSRLLLESQREPGIKSERLLAHLFRDVSFRDDMPSEELSRYRQANDTIGRYCHNLEQRFSAAQMPAGMLHELRAFYRMPQPDKFSHINSVRFA